jgi:hypothetical protein
MAVRARGVVVVIVLEDGMSCRCPNLQRTAVSFQGAELGEANIGWALLPAAGDSVKWLARLRGPEASNNT